jgi:hypothetical protein
MSRRVSKYVGIAWKQHWDVVANESIGRLHYGSDNAFDERDCDVKSGR